MYRRASIGRASIRLEAKPTERKILAEMLERTVFPLTACFKDNKLKVLLGVCRGKKAYDKRETIKERDIKREVSKNLKNY